MPTDQEVSDLPDLADPADTDQVMVNADPAGSPASSRVDLSSLLRLGHGYISVTGGVGSQTLVAATWTKVNQFTAELSGKNVTAAHATDKITLTKAAHWDLAITLTATHVATAIFLAFWWNGAEVLMSFEEQVADTSAHTYKVGIRLNATLAAKDVEFYVKSTAGGAFVVKDAQLSVNRVG